VPLAGVDRQQPGGSPSDQQPLVGLNGLAQPGNVVAERLAETARLQEVALHIDEDERATGRGKVE